MSGGQPRSETVNCKMTGETEYEKLAAVVEGESGLDYFGARYSSSNIGRFMTPDWSATAEPVPYAQLGDPQTLNLYAYATDNPTTITDATGHAAGGSNPGPPPTISQDTSRNALTEAGSVEACVLESTACAGAVNKPEAQAVTHKAKNAAENAQAHQQNDHPVHEAAVVNQTGATDAHGNSGHVQIIYANAQNTSGNGEIGVTGGLGVANATANIHAGHSVSGGVNVQFATANGGAHVSWTHGAGVSAEARLVQDSTSVSFRAGGRTFTITGTVAAFAIGGKAHVDFNHGLSAGVNVFLGLVGGGLNISVTGGN